MTLPVKKAFRRAALRRREAVHHALGSGAPAAVAAGVVACLAGRPPGVVAGYWPIGSELDVRPVLTALIDQGWSCVLPAIVGADRPLVFRSWAPGNHLMPGPLAIHEPPPGVPERDPDVILVPLVGFDAGGWRLGYGGGFYDRTLAGLGPVPAWGIAYRAQGFARLPRDPYDQPLDGIITEQGVLRCRCRGEPS